MKNFSLMKIFVIGVIFASAMIFSANCSASPITYLNSVVGNWYDTKGNLVLTISSDHKLNGMQVMNLNIDGDALVGIYEITYKDGNQNKFIEFWDLSSVNNSYKFLIMNPGKNNCYVLRKTKNPQYYESVGGIYLGMSESEVLRLYGTPSSKEHYNNGGIVTEITFYSNGDRKFDRTGVSARNSASEFARKYNARILQSNRGNGTAVQIGHGEAIILKNNSASLIIHQENTFAVW